MRYLFSAVGVVFLSAIISSCSAHNTESSLNAFNAHLQSLCGKTVEGRVISLDPQDEGWRKETLSLGPIGCPDEHITVLPLAVGADQSRIWTLKFLDAEGRLDFRHAHTLKDGSPDPVTGYGGVATLANSTTTKAIFPVDDISKALFLENGLQASMTNTWSLEINPNTEMIYTMSREGRNFVAVFDLSQGE